MSIKFSELAAQAMDNLFDKLTEEAAAPEHWTEGIMSAQTESLLAILKKTYQKIEIYQEDTDHGTFAARLWYNGKGMLPPNIEIYRVPSQTDAIRALYAAAWLAFPGEQNDPE